MLNLLRYFCGNGSTYHTRLGLETSQWFIHTEEREGDFALLKLIAICSFSLSVNTP